MFIEHNIVLKAFQRLAPNKVGGKRSKLPLERTTSLMILLAVDAVSKKHGEATIDLEYDSPNSRRKDFVQEYVKLVSVGEESKGSVQSVHELGSVKSDGKDPASRVSSNFITTIMNQAKVSRTKMGYPRRPAALLALGKAASGLPCGACLHPDWDKGIDEYFEGLVGDTPYSDLAIFCMRNIDGQKQSDLASTLCDMIANRYSGNLAGFWCGKIKSEQNKADHLKSAVFMEGEFVDALSSLNELTLCVVDSLTDEPHQKIVYGAPGTGKSNGVEKTAKKLPKEDVVRTTFHPDSDYSTFVGSYKPVMKSVPRTLMKGEEIAKVAKGDASLFCEQKISYEFVPQAFAKAYVQAWKRMAESGGGTVNPVMLVIEEINRGDCAKAFGDLFQLLDRRTEDDDQDSLKKAGFSEYPVLADSDLANYIRSELTGAKAAIEELGYDAIVADDKLELMLPPNMYIWATMNTSDQSLFPMDSAFKRRWEWRYVPIKNHKDKHWALEVDANHKYDWWDFLLKINQQILAATNSEDKQLGYFFAKSIDGVVSLDTFVNKVVFYLWNVVFKDCYSEYEIFKDGDGYLMFTKFFDDDGELLAEKAVKFLDALEVKPWKDSETPSADSSASAASVTADSSGMETPAPAN